MTGKVGLPEDKVHMITQHVFLLSDLQSGRSASMTLLWPNLHNGIMVHLKII